VEGEKVPVRESGWLDYEVAVEMNWELRVGRVKDVHPASRSAICGVTPIRLEL
jgi:hypothetical protein